ncbi:MAG: hypothetical protein AB1324_08485 [Candidatus Micrarchaeota archaeon]
MTNSQAKPNGDFRFLKAVYRNVNRLREEQGIEPVGGLGFAHKLEMHFRGEYNPRVARAIEEAERELAGAQ